MVKYHTDSERGNPLPPHGLHFPINSKGYFLYAPFHRQDSTYHGLCYISRGALTGTRNSSAIGSQTNGIYIKQKVKIKYVYIKNVQGKFQHCDINLCGIYIKTNKQL